MEIDKQAEFLKTKGHDTGSTWLEINGSGILDISKFQQEREGPRQSDQEVIEQNRKYMNGFVIEIRAVM